MLKDDACEQGIPHGADGIVIPAFASLLFSHPHERLNWQDIEDGSQPFEIAQRFNFFPRKKRSLRNDRHDGASLYNSLGNDSPSIARFPLLLDISCERSAPREWTVRPAIGRERMAGVE
jgi:hypothetical protein